MKKCYNGATNLKHKNFPNGLLVKQSKNINGQNIDKDLKNTIIVGRIT